MTGMNFFRDLCAFQVHGGITKTVYGHHLSIFRTNFELWRITVEKPMDICPKQYSIRRTLATSFVRRHYMSGFQY